MLEHDFKMEASVSTQAEEAKNSATDISIEALIERVPGIPVAQFRKGLAEFLDRARYQKERFPLAKHDKNVATLVSTADSDTLYLLDRISSQFGIERKELILALFTASEDNGSFGGVVSDKEQCRLDKLDAAAKKLGITPDELLQQTLSAAEESQKVRTERELCDD